MKGLKEAFDVQHPLFRPLWLRVLIIAFCFGWAVFEWSNGKTGWAALFVVCGAYLAHQYLSSG